MRNSNLISRMDECINSFKDAMIFLTVHVHSGYCQVKISNEDREKTALTSH